MLLEIFGILLAVLCKNINNISMSRVRKKNLDSTPWLAISICVLIIVATTVLYVYMAYIYNKTTAPNINVNTVVATSLLDTSVLYNGVVVLSNANSLTHCHDYFDLTNCKVNNLDISDQAQFIWISDLNNTVSTVTQTFTTPLHFKLVFNATTTNALQLYVIMNGYVKIVVNGALPTFHNASDYSAMPNGQVQQPTTISLSNINIGLNTVDLYCINGDGSTYSIQKPPTGVCAWCVDKTVVHDEVLIFCTNKQWTVQPIVLPVFESYMIETALNLTSNLWYASAILPTATANALAPVSIWNAFRNDQTTATTQTKTTPLKFQYYYTAAAAMPNAQLNFYVDDFLTMVTVNNKIVFTMNASPGINQGMSHSNTANIPGICNLPLKEGVNKIVLYCVNQIHAAGIVAWCLPNPESNNILFATNTSNWTVDRV